MHPAEGEPFIDYSSCYSLLRKGRIESNVSKSNVHGTVTECLNDFHNFNVFFCVVSCKDTQSLELKLYRVVLVSH